MKNLSFNKLGFLICFLVFSSNLLVSQETNLDFKELEAKIIDNDTKKPLASTNIVILGSNISTVSNTEGEFLLKVPSRFINSHIVITHLGYEDKKVKIVNVNNRVTIELNPVVTELDEVSIITSSMTAKEIVEETLRRKSSLYNNDRALMTAFYRETIKKRRKNASLSEAVVKIHKQPYNNIRNDHIELIKARKNTDYSKLDTLALKLQGGPFSNLYTDLIKYPEFIFTNEDLPLYKFSFENSTKIDDRQIYVVKFKQKEDNGVPLYYGKLYIDSETLALTNAVYGLNVSNRELSSRIYVRKKPRKAEVYPTEAKYRVNYRTTNGKWHYAYSNISLTFKVNWKGQLFNNTYTLSSEMAITDWEIYDTKLAKIRSKLIRPSTILSEKASGFSDPRFWGAYNIIEPEKSIESAIKKIQKQLKRT